MNNAEIGIKIKVDDAIKELKKLGRVTDAEAKDLSKVWKNTLTEQLTTGKKGAQQSARFSAEAMSTYKQATAAVLGDQINDVLDITASLGFLGPEVLAVGVAVGAVVGSMAALGISMKLAFEAGQTLTDWAIQANEGMKGLGEGVELSKAQLSGLQEVSDSFAAAGMAFDQQFLQVIGSSIPELKRVADALVPISIELSGALAEGLRMALPLLASFSEAMAAIYQVGSGVLEVFASQIPLVASLAERFAEISLEVTAFLNPLTYVGEALGALGGYAFDTAKEFFELSGKTGELRQSTGGLFDIYTKLVLLIKSYVQPAIETLTPVFKAVEEGISGVVRRVQGGMKEAVHAVLGEDAVAAAKTMLDEMDEAFAAISGAWTGETAAIDENYKATKRLVGQKRELTKANKELKTEMSVEDQAFWAMYDLDEMGRQRALDHEKKLAELQKQNDAERQRQRDKDTADAERLASQELTAKQSMLASAQALADISATYSRNRLSALQQELEAQEEAGTAGVGYIKQMIEQEKQRATRRAAFAKAIALTEAITQTYVAVTEALPNPLLAAAAGAAGAAAVASIAAAPLPQYHGGGVVTANLLQGEAVLNRSAVAAMGEQSVNRMNDRTNRQQNTTSNIYLKGRLVDQIVEEGVKNGPRTRRALSVTRSLAQYT